MSEKDKAGRTGGLASVKRGRGRPPRAGAEARKLLVAELALKRLSVREIAAAMAALPAKERPAGCSASAVGRDLKQLKEEWAAARRAVVEELVDEEVARLNTPEKAWWPKAVDG